MHTLTKLIKRLGASDETVDGGPVRAEWNGVTLAESDRTVVIEGNHYFPPDSLSREYLEHSPRTSLCPWKGTASYYDIVVDGERNPAAAWFYPSPTAAAEPFKDHVAFWNGVRVRPVEPDAASEPDAA